MPCGYVWTTTVRIWHQVPYRAGQQTRLVSKSPTELCSDLTSSRSLEQICAEVPCASKFDYSNDQISLHPECASITAGAFWSTRDSSLRVWKHFAQLQGGLGASRSTSARCKLVQKPHPNLPDTPVALTSDSKYFQMLPGPLELCNVLLESARAFSDSPEGTCSYGGTFRMLWDSLGAESNFVAAEISTQACRRLCAQLRPLCKLCSRLGAIFTQQWFGGAAAAVGIIFGLSVPQPQGISFILFVFVAVTRFSTA